MHVILTVLCACKAEAIRGGLESVVGITSLGAFRCDRMTLPLFCHMMTIGVLAIWEPKPLDKYMKLSQALCGERRCHTWPSIRIELYQGQ